VEVCAFATEKFFLILVAFGFSAAKREDELI
jgi:hypothetical protein